MKALRIKVYLREEEIEVSVLKTFWVLNQPLKVCKNRGMYIVVWKTKVLWVMPKAKNSDKVIERFTEVIGNRGYTEVEFADILEKF